jgi:hypothetical protein
MAPYIPQTTLLQRSGEMMEQEKASVKAFLLTSFDQKVGLTDFFVL